MLQTIWFPPCFIFTSKCENRVTRKPKIIPQDDTLFSFKISKHEDTSNLDFDVFRIVAFLCFFLTRSGCTCAWRLNSLDLLHVWQISLHMHNQMREKNKKRQQGEKRGAKICLSQSIYVSSNAKKRHGVNHPPYEIKTHKIPRWHVNDRLGRYVEALHFSLLN